MRACQPVEHCFDRGDLPTGFHCVIEVRVSPPVPAPERVSGRKRIDSGVTGGGLWKEDDQAIAVSPLVVAGMLDITALDRLDILLAAVQRDVHAAPLPCGTRGRNVHIPGLSHA